jgi:CubicO group peptidase (beta-lactamase class C family)
MAIGGVHNGQEFKVFLGEKALGNPVAPDSTTIYQIGSVTKTFTSLVLSELIQSGQVNLDDPISKFLPEITGFAGSITLKQLATHTSGLPRLPANFSASSASNPYKDYSPRQLIEALKDSKLLPHAGPYPISYSNMGVGLLGYILTQVTDLSYENMISRYVTQPLGLKNTGTLRSAQQVRDSAQAYDDSLTANPFWTFQDSTIGAGGIFSDLDDMITYLGANLNPDQSPIGQAIAFSHQVEAYGNADSVGIPSNSNIGLNWILNTYNGENVIWHNGEVGGFLSLSVVNQTTQSTIEVLSNTANGRFQGCVLALITDQKCAPMPAEFPVSQADLENLVGTYHFQNGDIKKVKILKNESFLSMVIPSEGNYRLYAMAQNQFSISSESFGTAVFQANSQGVINQISVTIDGKTYSGAKK